MVAKYTLKSLMVANLLEILLRKDQESDLYSDQLNDSKTSLHCKVLMVMFYSFGSKITSEFTSFGSNQIYPKATGPPVGHSME